MCFHPNGNFQVCSFYRSRGQELYTVSSLSSMLANDLWKKWSSRPRSAFCSDYCSWLCVHTTTLWLALSVPYCRSMLFVCFSYLRWLVLKFGFGSSTLEKLKCESSTLDVYSNLLFICCLKIGGKYSMHSLDKDKVKNIIKLQGNEERMRQQANDFSLKLGKHGELRRVNIFNLLL